MKVEYLSEAFKNSGYGDASRRNIILLKRAGFDVSVTQIDSDDTKLSDDWKYQECKRLKNKFNDPDIRISHILACAMDKVHRDGVKNICYTTWETDLLPTDWVAKLNKYADECWVTATRIKKVFEESGVKIPVKVLPPTLFPEDIKSADEPINQTNLDPIINNLRPKNFCFYSIFQWIPRKNPDALLEAYVSEFDASEPVTLLLKSYRVDHSPAETKAMIQTINNLTIEMGCGRELLPDILLIHEQLSNESMKAIHKLGDCFVLPHRGEGTGLPIVDAIMFNNPVITTAYGGPEDFLTEYNQKKLPYRMRPVRNAFWAYNYFNCYMNWADVDVMDLRNWMRDAYERRDSPAIIAEQRKKLLDSYGQDTTLKMVKEMLT